ncbi:MAG TPA: hypothetical protein VN666_11145 [Nitrospira sp.]|nr:hypothetical protein [Nitrospira sp.]
MSTPTYTDQSLIALGDSVADRGEPHPPDDPAASGNLDKIRDILLGAQAREHDRRFAQLEQHLIREATDLRSDLKRRFESLELYIKKEVDSLTNRLTKEQEVRGESVTNLTQELTHLAATLENKARQLETQATQAQTNFLQQLAERTSELATNVRARHAEATSALDRAVHDLRTEKASRAALAAILMKASKQLSDDDPRSDRA